MKPFVATAMTAALLTAACGPAGDTDASGEATRAAVDTIEAGALDALRQRVDSLDAILADQPGLTADERYQLRQYLQPEQLAAARRLGLDEPPADSAAVRTLLDEGVLVALEDTTRFWVVRELTHSFPYVTPDAYAMLTELGRRFHVRLDSLGLPPFRFEVTSVLRSAELQSELRRGNANASRGTSSHEFGTTVDIAYRDFAAPPEPAFGLPLDPPDSVRVPDPERRALERRVAEVAAERLTTLGEDRAVNLKGILGEVLKALQEEGASLPLHERGQAVFHVTVGRPYPEAGG